ncbi:hypothetical protein PIB30_078475 [Stylosanthes scabra]|uniref:Uncharacterized protein n=1 Tax=Stylosanthes scabra TaxID=79078 RepID=A0ABU6UPN6_9FABA|nr:hypothetical protein [Stylosanthes scabra]
MVNVGELEVGIGNGGQGCQVVVLGCSMARRKSRASIELGVQRAKDFGTCCRESIQRKLESILFNGSGFGNDLRVDSGDLGIDLLESRF